MVNGCNPVMDLPSSTAFPAIRLYCRNPQFHARDATTDAAHALDRRHADAVCYNGRHFREEIVPSTTIEHAARCVLSLSFSPRLLLTRTASALHLCRCIPVCPSIAVSTARHRERPRHPHTTSFALFFSPRRGKIRRPCNASQIRMHRTNPHCAHA
jgi:hypothetical protein